MAKKELTDEQLAILDDSYPVSEDSNRPQFPRLGMLAKDITEEIGKGRTKTIKIVQPAGMFFTEKDLGETNEEGKKVWTKEFFEADSIDVIIVFHRRQLRKFDSGLKKFISTPLFDTNEQVVPLYLDRQVIRRGTQAQLQAQYPALTQKGKATSDLKEDAILFVVYNDELYQMNLSQSSKWEFKTYKKNLNPSTVITSISPVEDTFGDNTFTKMLFKNKRKITADEFDIVVEKQTVVKDVVKSDEKFYLTSGNQEEMNETEKKALKAAEKF